MALKGIKVIELCGLAPSPFCGKILSDFGADVLVIDKMKQGIFSDIFKGQKKYLQIDLKKKEGKQILLNLTSKADVFIEPFRAGVAEKMGFGPNNLLKLNKGLIYARLTGYGQTGPMAKVAGHDLNFLAISGLLSILGTKEGKPSPPLNLLADFAGGGLICALGICIALIERNTSGLGQVIDCSMVEGANYIASWIWETRMNEKVASILWPNISERGNNILDGGFPLYNTYKTKDGKFMAVAALERQFMEKVLTLLGINLEEYKSKSFEKYNKLFHEITEIFKTKTQEEWTELFLMEDACVTPVVDIETAHLFEHNKVRNSFKKATPRPAPLFSPNKLEDKPIPQIKSRDILIENEYTEEEIDELIRKEIIA